MVTDNIINDAVAYIQTLFAGDSSGHDADHTLRVYRTAVYLAVREGADKETVALAALLHDADDIKLFPETASTKAHAVAFLAAHGVDEARIREIVKIIDEVSFKGTDSVVPATPEGRCVQDADRLDAIGAIGIARTFAYGGSHGRKLYDPAETPRTDLNEQTYRQSASGTVSHFYEKLFKLKDMMNTETAKALAERRDRFMHEFLDEFFAEWEGVPGCQ